MARQFVHGKRFFLDEFGVETEEVVAARHVRLHRRRCRSWCTCRGSEVVPHAEDLLEPDQQVPAPHVLVGGHRRHPGLHALPAGRHLQRRAQRQRDGPRGAQLQGQGPRPTRSLVAVRLGRRRRRPHPRDARPGRAAARPRGLGAGARSRRPPRSSRRPRRSTRTPPVWVGELYLELHRGTYTSQAKTKQGNRRSEHLLREAELWAATAAVRAGLAYPYERAGPDLEDGAAAPVPRHPARLVDRLGAPRGRETYAAARRASWRRSSTPRSGRSPARAPASSSSTRAPHAAAGVPAGGAAPAAAGATPVSVTRRRRRIRPRQRPAAGSWSTAAAWSSRSCDVGERPRGGRPRARPANLLQLHPDFPNKWDAWDVDQFYRNTGHRPDRRRRDRQVARRRAVRGRARAFGASTVDADDHARAPVERGVDVDTEVDWHETEKFLKVAFPLDVHADRSAVGDPVRARATGPRTPTPAGRRPSSRSARTASCTSGSPAGASAVVNDSTYGHDVTRTVRPDGGTTTTRAAVAAAGARASPTRRPTRACTGSGTRWCRARTSATPSARATGSTCPSGAVPARPRSRRW